MPSICDTAVCLRRWDFSETSQTVSLFSREHGLLRGLAKGSKRERGKFSGGFDVLTRGQILAIVKPGRDLATLTEWTLQETYRALRERLDANRAALYMVDLAHHLLTDHDPHPALFDALTQSLRDLADPARVPSTLLGFQWSLLEETGYQPAVDRDAETGETIPSDQPVLAFSPAAGGLVVDPDAAGAWRTRRATVEVLQRLARGEPHDDAPRDAVERANRLLAAYCRHVAGRDIPAMRWAFDDLRFDAR